MAPRTVAAVAVVQLVFLITSLGLLAYIISKFSEAKDFLDNFNPQATLAGLSQGKLPTIPNTFESFGGFSMLGVTRAQLYQGLASGNVAALLPLLSKLPAILSKLSKILKVLTALGSTTLAFNVLLLLAAVWLLVSATKSTSSGSNKGSVLFFWAMQFFYFVFGIAFVAYTSVKSEEGTSVFYAFVAMWAISVVIGFVACALSFGLLKNRSPSHGNVEMHEKEATV